MKASSTVYVDTSFAVSLLMDDDDNSERAAAFMDRFSGAIIFSDWTLLEFRAIVNRTIDVGIFDVDQGSATDAQFLRWARDDGQIFDVLPEHYAGARELMTSRKVPLRAPDSLHLAMCLRWGLVMLSFDKGLIRAAQAHDCPVAPLYA